MAGSVRGRQPRRRGALDVGGRVQQPRFLLRIQGRHKEAIEQFRHAIALNPRFREAHINLGTVYHEMGRLDESLDAYRAAIAISTHSAEAHINLANALKDAGQIREALAEHQVAATLSGDPLMRHNLLLTTHYVPGLSAAQILDLHLVARDVAARAGPERHAWEDAKSIERNSAESATRRLRIGYVSGDFKNHVVGYNILPLLANHDQRGSRFSVTPTCRPRRRHPKFRGWPTRGATSTGSPTARRRTSIRQDRIDVLVDLSLHSAGLASASSRGSRPRCKSLCRLSRHHAARRDRLPPHRPDHLDPPGHRRLLRRSHRLYRLPDTFWCYPDVADVTTSTVNAAPARRTATSHSAA